MKQKKGLQRLTKSQQKIEKLFSLKQINQSDIEGLTKAENDYLNELLTEKVNSLKGADRDRFLRKIEPITSEATKNQLWETNHNKIMWAISTLLQEYNRMPSKTEISNKAELSRQTVHKHLKEYHQHPHHLEQMEQFRFMATRVLAMVYRYAINGDTSAAKLYFNIIGLLNNGQQSTKATVQHQNNYIQINNTILSQQSIQHLNPEQLNSIEAILKTALPKLEKALN